MAFWGKKLLKERRIKTFNAKWLKEQMCRGYGNVSLSKEVRKILIVDDSRFSVTAFVKIVEKLENVDISIVTGGSQCLDVHRKLYNSGLLFHVIFLDLIMPPPDGYQTAKRLRNTETKESMLPTYVCGISGDSAQ
jgi:PleD family two-component response regulator